MGLGLGSLAGFGPSLRAGCFGLLLLGTGHAEGLRDHLGMFFDLGQDSVAALVQLSPTLLELEAVNTVSGKRRILQEEVGSKPMAKLLAEASGSGVKVTPLDSPGMIPPEVPAPGSPPAPAPAAKAVPLAQPPRERAAPIGQTAPPAGSARTRSLSSPRKNRMYYIGTQTVLSTYVYGVSIPLALDVDNPRVQFGIPFVTAPFAFAAHLFFAKNRTFEDSHRKGTGYLSISSLYASYALPFALMGWEEEDDHPFRVAAFASMAAYPLGIWGGYLLGDRYVDMPGRIDTQSKFALNFGLLGFFTPFLYFDQLENNVDDIVRLGLGQSVALATAGHFLAGYYRAGENIPEGVNTGILNHTALGALLGVEVAALADAESVRPWLGGAIAGGTAGLMEGLYYYRKSYDSKERGLYNSLGALAGAAMGFGVWFMLDLQNPSSYSYKVATASLLVGGTWLGYWATNFLTQGLEDRTGARSQTWSDRLAINLMPIPEPEFRNRELHYRYRLGSLTYRW